MEPLLIKEVYIVDGDEKIASHSTFYKGLNVVTSENTSRGKSSTLRAILYSFGCEANFDKVMKAASKIFAVKVDYGENNFVIVRKSRTFAIFKNDEYVFGCDGDFKSLSEFYKNEFGFSVFLTNRNKQYEIAPVGYSFLPYFLDQDSSWKSKSTNPFNLDCQYINDKNDLFYYHLGILNVEYYKFKNEKYSVNSDIEQLQIVAKDILEKIKNYKNDFKTTSLSVDVNDAKATIAIIKNEIEDLLLRQSALQHDIINKENLVSKLTSQNDLIEKLINKQEDEIVKENIVCPNCGCEFTKDYQKLYNNELLLSNRDYIRITLENVNKSLVPLKEEYNCISNLIEEKTNFYKTKNATFKEYLRAESISEVICELEKKYSEYSLILESKKEKLYALEEILNNYENKKSEANKYFKNIYYNNLLDLGIKSITKEDIKPFEKVQISGNKYIRSTLAFFLAFLFLKNQYESSYFKLPIVVDSPFEGDPDEINKEDIIKAIVDFYNSSSDDVQLIIGLREAKKYFDTNEKDINYISLNTSEDKVMDSNTYNELKNEIEKFSSIIDSVKRFKKVGETR